MPMGMPPDFFRDQGSKTEGFNNAGRVSKTTSYRHYVTIISFKPIY